MVLAVDCSDTADLLATGDVTGAARLWEVATGTELRAFKCGGVVFAVKLSEDRQLLATGDVKGVAKLWRVADGTPKLELQCSGAVRVASARAS